jgi:hypothetical protein
MWNRLARVLVLALTASVLVGCQPDDDERRNYVFGLARIGDTYRLFAPMCPGDRLLELTISQVSDSSSETVWWEAGGPKEPDSPREFLILGREDPFRDVTVRVDGDAKRPTSPSLAVAAVHTNRYGGIYHNHGGFQLASVPSYPATAAVDKIRYTAPGAGDLLSPDAIRRESDCAAGPPEDVKAMPSLQPASSFRSGAAERVEAAMLGPDVLTWMDPASRTPYHDEDVAAHVCDNGPDSGALVAAFGRARNWKGRDTVESDDARVVRQFAGAYGAITAAEAIDQVNGEFGCKRYTDFVDVYTGVGRVGLPELPGVDRQLLYCEQGEDTADRCTLLLARGDILSRITVEAATEAEAERDVRALADDAAEALTRT